MSYTPSSERPGRNPRAEILREAEYLVNGSRNTQYGDPNQGSRRPASAPNPNLHTHPIAATRRREAVTALIAAVAASPTTERTPS